MAPVWEVSLTPTLQASPSVGRGEKCQGSTAPSEVPGDLALHKLGTTTISISAWEAT